LFFFANLNFLPLNILLFIPSLILAAMIYFFVSYLVGLSAFYFGMIAGLNFIMSNVIAFFSGSILPLDLLPDNVYRLANFLPFKYIAFFPLNIIQGKLSLLEIGWGFVGGVLWLGILFLLTKLIYRNGVKKYEAYGA
jgi:ABC-2 type transport system permease protein